jgi:hypothetical protein
VRRNSFESQLHPPPDVDGYNAREMSGLATLRTAARLDFTVFSADITRMDLKRIGVTLALTVVVALMPAACSRAPQGSATDGRLTGGVYTNSFFGFSFSPPAGWPDSSQAVIEQARRDRSNAIAAAGNTAELQRQAAAAADSHHLLFISEKPWGGATDSNPSIIIAAEDVSGDRRIRTGKDYIVKVSRLLANSPLPYQPSGEIREVEAGGATFGRLDFTANIAGKTLRQTHLARVIHAHALTFILSAGSEAELQKVEAALKSLRFH